MAPKPRSSRRKVRKQTVVNLPEEDFLSPSERSLSDRAEMLKIAAMLERLAAEIKRLLGPRA